MIEHNNRAKADKFAEYITGDELRRYTAQKVEYYCGQDISLFDGAAGSGQLAQYIKPKHIEAVEIQSDACDALAKNYPCSVITNDSFFNYESDVICDAVVMNPPFSMKFKDLSDVERQSIQSEFDWKKSGVVDDIFVLKSLKYTSRFGFYILFLGVCYRKTELKFREFLGNSVVELNCIQNAFVDTTISVLFLVIDKQKISTEVKRELYDCKTKQVLVSDLWQLDSDSWQTVQVERKQAVIDIDAVNNALIDSAINNLELELKRSTMLNEVFDAGIDINRAVDRVRCICDGYEVVYD